MKKPRSARWADGLAEWIDGDNACLSIAFTWRLADAYSRACWHRAAGYKVRAGGPALFLKKLHYLLADVAEIGGDMPDAVQRHNPMATIASRGCPVGCSFCIVPAMEGRAFTELPDFPVRPILCDNNLSALSPQYQRHIVARYRPPVAGEGEWMVADLHSHGTAPPFFSSTDDADDAASTHISIVFGNLGRLPETLPRYVARLCAGGGTFPIFAPPFADPGNDDLHAPDAPEFQPSR